jgi:hypothetical protein
MSYKRSRLLHHWKKKFNGSQNLSKAKGSKHAPTSSVKYVPFAGYLFTRRSEFHPVSATLSVRYLGYRNDYAHRLEGIGASR